MALRARIIRMWMEMHLIFLYIYIILAVAVFNNKFNNLHFWTRVPSGQASGMRQGRAWGSGSSFGRPWPSNTRPCPQIPGPARPCTTLIIGRSTKTSLNSSNTVLVARTTSEGCANPNCQAKKRSTHTTANCYWPGGGKEGQFPPNFGQRNRANAVTIGSTNSQTEHFVLSAIIPDTPGQFGILIDDHPRALVSQGFQNFQKGKIPTFMDSGVSDTMFVSRNVFSEYKSVTPRKGDSAKAENGSFEIVGEGHDVQRYQVDGREREITYTHTLHMPTLNANLISVGALDKAGLTTTFGNGKGVTCKIDGAVILSGRNVNGMYLLESVGNPPDNAIAMTSLSKPTSLDQWHRRLTHCSPLTIQEMAMHNLVDGLIISEMTISGQCEDCIMGRQTRRRFDGELVKT